MLKRINMEEITKNHSSHLERDTPLSPKRPRTDRTIANLLSGEIHFDFSGLLTSSNAEGPTPLPLSTIHTDNSPLMVEFDHEYVKHNELPCEDTNLREMAVIMGATPPTQDYTRPTLSAVSANITTGGCKELIWQGKNEPHPEDDVSAESHTLHTPGTTVSALQDRRGLGASLQRLPSAEEVRSRHPGHVVISTVVSQSTREGSESGKHRADGVTRSEDVIQDECFYEMSCEACVDEERDQCGNERGVLQNSLGGEVEGHTAHGDCRVAVSPSTSPGFAWEREEDAAWWGGDVNGNTDACCQETNVVCDAANDPISADTEADHFDKGFVVAGDVGFDSRQPHCGAEINTGLRREALRVATEDCAAGEVTAYALSQTPGDHTPVERRPETSAQPAAGGEHGTGLSGVMDPAFWREADEAAEEPRTGSGGSTGVETSPETLVLEHAASRPAASHAEDESETVRKSGRSESSNATRQDGGKSEGVCLSSVENSYFTSTAAAAEHVASDNSIHLGHLHSSSSPADSTAESFHVFYQSEGKAEAAASRREERNAAGPVHDSLDQPRPESIDTDVDSSQSSLTNGASRNDEGDIAKSREGTNAVEFATSANTVRNDAARTSDVPGVSTDDWINDWAEGRLSSCGDSPASLLPVDDAPGNGLALAGYGHVTETFAAANQDAEPFSSLHSILARDAVVPGPYPVVDGDRPVVDGDRSDGDRASVAAPPSPAALSRRAPGVHEAFEKVRLSPRGEGGDLEDSPPLTSTPSQGLRAPRLLLHHDDLVPDAGARHGEEEEEEGEVTDGSCDVPSFLSSHCPLLLLSPGPHPPPQFVPALQETARFDPRPPTNDFALIPASETSVSGNQDSSEFEMKERFDMVLEELSLYFEISPNDSTLGSLSSPEHSAPNKDGFQEVHGSVSNASDRPTSPAVESNANASVDTDEDCALKVYAGTPEAIFTGGNGYSEQEVPLESSHHCPEAEETLYAPVRHQEPREPEERLQKWTSSFMSLPEQRQPNPGQREKTTRLEPLLTCTRPIRVGLSKRAKTKHLHPYK